MAHARAWTALLICFMFGLRKDLTLAVSWKAFGVILIIKALIFLGFSILADISVLLILAIIKIW